MSIQCVHAILLLLFVCVRDECMSMEKDGLSSHSSASMWFERASVLKHTTHQFVDDYHYDDNNDDENMSTVKTPLFCRSHSQWL